MATTIDNQRWLSAPSPLSYDGRQIVLRLIQHLAGVEDYEKEFRDAEKRVSSARVGEVIIDAYRQEFTRVE